MNNSAFKRKTLVAGIIAAGLTCILSYQNCGSKTSGAFAITVGDGSNTGASTAALSLGAINLSAPAIQAGGVLSATVGVSGANLSGVNCAWSISGGSASNSGLIAGNICSFSAAVSVAGTLSVTVTNAAGETATASAPFSITTPAPTPLPTIPSAAINVGGAAYFGPTGISWGADRNFSGGSANHYYTGVTNAPGNDQVVYESNRGGNFSYTIPIPIGSHQVTLKFAEYYHSGANQRLFNVILNGTTVLSSFDIFAAAGGRYMAVDKTFTVNVTTGYVTIVLQSVLDVAQLNGILIY